MSRFPRRGLYAITPDRDFAADMLESAAAAAIQGGAAAIQYRRKNGSGRHHEQARALLGICRRSRVPLIINDDVALAVEIGADGVHVGRDDADATSVRSALGPDAIVGVSCYASTARAVEAAAAGADYVAFGSFYPSLTKPGATPCPAAVLREARERVSLPLVAIGGITAENGGALVEAGADLLAVIQDVFGHADVRSAAARLAALFD